ncbi:TetR family transcriptional regulator [Prolixibacter bellariivorans]|uniref:TetR family transcriptional regulator n=1 Tax=Prolixibacter bellariivorans TaxID=314319 RepID=A0A5M4AW63_9BACT|nr:TetR family transcriptional regulator [Prolixibacter bellariivorans]
MKEETRCNILNVAKRLFAQQGIGKTTMMDVAHASGLGRRTLYMYYKTRDELYRAVVKSEIELIISRLQDVMKTNISPDKKFIRFVAVRMQALEDLVRRNRSIRSDFLNNQSRIEEIRKELDLQEKVYLTKILKEGDKRGTFRIENPEITATIAHTTIKGFEPVFIRDGFGSNYQTTLNLCIKILFQGIRPQIK